VTSFPDYGDLGPDHGPASADGVEVVEVMPNTVPRPAPVGVTSEPGIAETNSGPNTVQPLAPETTSLTGAGVGRQSIPSLTQYRPPSVSLWPSAEPDSHERENAGPTETYIPFGLVSVTGSMEEQVSAEAIPLKLDLELDLPALAIPATQPGGAKPAAGAPLQAELMPALDLELPMHPAAGATPAPDSETATRIEPDLGQRHDDVLATVPMAVVLSDPAEPATVQFRLIQFAAVLEQIDEMEKSQEPAKAIALLRQYVLRDESIPTLFWLLLFRFYKEINKKPVYEALGEHFARRYRRPMASWEEKLESRAPQLGLRDLPDIDARVRAHWGKREGIEIIRVLVCERDQADAVVFNEPLQRDLLQLAKIFPLDEQPV